MVLNLDSTGRSVTRVRSGETHPQFRVRLSPNQYAEVDLIQAWFGISVFKAALLRRLRA